MTIHWPAFLISLALLLPPPLLAGSLRKSVMKPRRYATQPGALLKPWQNWVDLIRAAIGAYLLTKVAVEVLPDVKGAGIKALSVEAAVCTVAILLQMVRVSPGIQLIAPVFYLSGLTLVLAGYTSGGFAVFVGWLFAIGGKNAAYQLPIMGVALAIAGSVLELSLPLILNCGLIFVPLVLAFLFQKQLAFVSAEPARMITTSSALKPATSDVKRG
ncbi:MAG: hypothetical protein FJ403_09155 [Verrucomicrobia bacterium]|nr:hypothetical protein [Verrucomicrobiota bacterium]